MIPFILSILIVFFGLINMFRMAFFLVGSDIYGLQLTRSKKKSSKSRYPLFSVVIPAHNEGNTVLRSLTSVVQSNYPKDRLEVIVMDDGSTDNTAAIIKKYIKENPKANIRLIRQKNTGKATALNNGMRKYATGSLIMCLDADSALDPDAIKNTVWHFRDKSVATMSANIRIVRRKGLLNLIQWYEYLVCYQMKRAESLFNFEYIVGGIGSTFRKSVLEKIGYYDTNTVTEDIDLTMKILRLGNKKYKATYGSDVVAYTESVMSIQGLIKQRYRWKWGRSQTFLKNLDMFFSTDKKYTKALTWFYLPFAIYGDFAFLFEPLLLAFILINAINFRDPLALISACIVITVYISFNILAEDTIRFKDKIGYLLFAPTMYVFFYLLSFVEYVALVRMLVNVYKLPQSIRSENGGWTHVERPVAELA